jgi:hypothetical protein
MCGKVIALEHHADPLARGSDLALRHAEALTGSAVDAIADRLAVDRN